MTGNLKPVFLGQIQPAWSGVEDKKSDLTQQLP